MRHQFLSLFLCSALAGSLVSCVNDEYDINKIEIGEISALEGISVPVGSSDKIMISEILAIEENSDFIKYDDQGNYYAIVKDLDAFNSSVTIPDFEFAGYDADNQNDFTIGEPVYVPAFNMEFVTPPIPFTDVVYDIEINQTDIPEIVSSVSYAEVESTLKVIFKYDKSSVPFDHITIDSGTSVLFPEWVILGTPNFDCENVGGHQFVLTEAIDILPESSVLEFPLDAIDFTKFPEGQGLIDKGHLYIDAEVHLTGSIVLSASTCSTSGYYQPIVSTYLHMDPMEIKNVRLAKVDLGEDAHASIKVNLKEEFPDMLYNSGITYDFNALSLNVNLYNGFPFAGDLDVAIDSYQTEGAEPNHVALTMPVEYQLNVDDNEQNHHFTDINSLLNPLPEYMIVSTDVRIDDLADQTEQYEDYGLITPGSTYSLRGGYEFLAPLSFGSRFRIDLNDQVTGLKIDATAEEAAGANVAEAHLKMNLVNTLPLDFQISAQALDAEGNVLDYLNVELEGAIKGGSVSAPSVNPLIIKAKNSGELKLDGIKFHLSATPSDGGLVLNKNHYIQVTDISMSLPQGVKFRVD